MLDVSWQRDPNQPSAWQIQLEISTCFIFKGPRGMTLQLPNNKIRDPIHFLYLGCLTGAKRREWMGMGVAGIIINSYCGSFPHSLLSTGKMLLVCNRISKSPSHSRRLPQHPVADVWNVDGWSVDELLPENKWGKKTIVQPSTKHHFHDLSISSVVFVWSKGLAQWDYFYCCAVGLISWGLAQL